MSIKCTNGTIKDSKKNTVNCNQLTDENCFDDSYKYCNKLNTGQIIKMVAISVISIILLVIIVHFLSYIPIVGPMAKRIIYLIGFVIIGVSVYEIYKNYKAIPKPPKKK
jgi:hypothetical protein